MKLELMPMFWLAFTLLAYLFSRWIYRRTGRYLLSPLILVPALLLALAVPLHTAYAEYSSNTHWLMLVLGPVTVAFAVPIWQQRRLLVRHWSALLLGMVAGSAASIATSFGLAKALALDSSVTMSLVPRSITTPFAMPLAQDLGGTGIDGGVCDVHRGVRRDARRRALEVVAVAQCLGAWSPVRGRRARRRGQSRP
ncbi:hypothetical protein PHLH6_09510 [Pseudomonas sp. Seg1]|nr:hypothetical protein PHLH6_09510 [Pseudomonas sp. Seg1]